jgi:hypothetical protein
MARGLTLVMLGLVAPASAFQVPCRSPTQTVVGGRMATGRRIFAVRCHGSRLVMQESRQKADPAALGVVLQKGLRKLAPLAGLVFGTRPWMGPAVHAEETATTKTLEASAAKVGFEARR